MLGVETMDRKVLLIGNGFDLVHDLPTSYEDFLQILKRPDSFRDALEKAIKVQENGVTVENSGEWSRYLSNVADITLTRIDEMITNIRQSSWAQYYAHCNAEINGWIDFEREILPAIGMFQKVLNSQVRVRKYSNDINATITINDTNIARMAKQWGKFFGVTEVQEQGVAEIQIKSRYCDENYGILKEKMLDDLYLDFRKLILAFGIYIEEVIDLKEVKEKPLFKSLKVTDIINFNYTATFRHYRNLNEANVKYVHGSTKNISTIVMGINEVPDDRNYDFKEYEKSAQRLFYDVKQSYKDIIESDELFELYIFGHSLDITDKNILGPFLRKAAHVTIYYYDDARKKDYYNKIKNVMALLGDNDAEDMMRRGVIEYEKYYE